MGHFFVASSTDYIQMVSLATGMAAASSYIPRYLFPFALRPLPVVASRSLVRPPPCLLQNPSAVAELQSRYVEGDRGADLFEPCKVRKPMARRG